MLGTNEILKPLFIEIDDTRFPVKIVAYEFVTRLREQDLPVVPGRKQPCDSIDRGAEVAAVALLRGAGMNRHSYLDRTGFAPRRIG